MKELVTLLILLGTHTLVFGIPASSIYCGDICSAAAGSSYTLTCTWSGTLATGIIWTRDGGSVMTCDQSGTLCVSTPSGYASGSYPNSTAATITITSFNTATDAGLWECSDGADTPQTCPLPDIALGTLQGDCQRNGNSYDISCTGITHGSPPVTLGLKDGTTVLDSTTTTGNVSSTQTNAAGKTYTCLATGTAAACLSPSSINITCPPGSGSRNLQFKWVLILLCGILRTVLY